jgi:hypothetical protein
MDHDITQHHPALTNIPLSVRYELGVSVVVPLRAGEKMEWSIEK